MQKPAAAEHPVHDFIVQRWSPRAFSDKPVLPEVLRSLFEAARWAASSYNDQPWAYIVATKDDEKNYSKLLSVLVDMNAAWAKQAPVLAISVARKHFKHNGAPNRVALHDVGAANAQLTMEATSRGLLVHQMAGFDQSKAREVFGIPEGWDPVSAIAIGYPGDPETLPENFRTPELAPRTRKPLSEFVMTGHWGHTAPFLSK
ncbi:MAG TPA: nitroreductase family protein [Candidatus Acidoferrum sp.]|nr:nitroreductase family protein [Candidatus Acidoferrum sp.]